MKESKLAEHSKKHWESVKINRPCSECKIVLSGKFGQMVEAGETIRAWICHRCGHHNPIETGKDGKIPIESWGFETALLHVKAGQSVRRQAWPVERVLMRDGPRALKVSQSGASDGRFCYSIPHEDILATDWEIAS